MQLSGIGDTRGNNSSQNEQKVSSWIESLDLDRCEVAQHQEVDTSTLGDPVVRSILVKPIERSAFSIEISFVGDEHLGFVVFGAEKQARVALWGFEPIKLPVEVLLCFANATKTGSVQVAWWKGLGDFGSRKLLVDDGFFQKLHKAGVNVRSLRIAKKNPRYSVFLTVLEGKPWQG